MFVVSERNIIIPGPDGQKFHMPRKYMGEVPACVEESSYFKALVKDGKVIISASGKDKDVDAALEGKGGRRSGKKKKDSPSLAVNLDLDDGSGGDLGKEETPPEEGEDS